MALGVAVAAGSPLTHHTLIISIDLALSLSPLPTPTTLCPPPTRCLAGVLQPQHVLPRAPGGGRLTLPHSLPQHPAGCSASTGWAAARGTGRCSTAIMCRRGDDGQGGCSRRRRNAAEEGMSVREGMQAGRRLQHWCSCQLRLGKAAGVAVAEPGPGGASRRRQSAGWLGQVLPLMWRELS